MPPYRRQFPPSAPGGLGRAPPTCVLSALRIGYPTLPGSGEGPSLLCPRASEACPDDEGGAGYTRRDHRVLSRLTRCSQPPRALSWVCQSLSRLEVSGQDQSPQMLPTSVAVAVEKTGRFGGAEKEKCKLGTTPDPEVQLNSGSLLASVHHPPLPPRLAGYRHRRAPARARV